MKRKIWAILISIMIIFTMCNISYAGISISNSQVSMKKGESKSVTLTGSGVTGTVNVSSSNPGVASASSANWVENNSISINITGQKEGSATITVSGIVSDDNGNDSNYTRTINVSVTNNSTGGANSTKVTSEQEKQSNDNLATQKLSNANLSNLGIRPNDFTGFRPETTTYNVTVPEDLESIEIYATPAQSKATVSGTGTKTLKKGDNALSVVVTAENGTTKTYTINVTRQGTEENEEENEEEQQEDTEIKKGLSNIIIGDLELSPSFQTNVYEYTTKYVGEEKSLDIQAVATDSNYTVEIIGNEELKEGDNVITILVTDTEGNNIATYQVTVNKALAEEKNTENEQQEQQKRMLILLGGIIAVIIIIIIIFIIRNRRKRAFAEEFSGVPFSKLNDIEDDNYNDNLDSYYNRAEYYNQDMQINSNEINDNPNFDDKDESQITDNKIVDNDKDKNSEIDDLRYINSNNPELLEKEKAKKEFLNGYNFDNDEYLEDKPRRGRKKGKRFK